MIRFNCVVVAVALLAPCATFGAASPKSRLIVMADMGNEPDEEQQMTHLLMYANMIDLEGLIACSGKYLHADRTDGRTKVRPDLFHKLVDGYAQVLGNLKQHATGWPEAGHLRSIIRAGTAGYGIGAVEPGRSNEASKLIEAAILKEDPRNLYVVGNAGTNTLAQALVDLDLGRSQEEMERLCARIIVFENGAQDNSGVWLTDPGRLYWGGWSGRFSRIRRELRSFRRPEPPIRPELDGMYACAMPGRTKPY